MQAVIGELGGNEKVDIIQWSEDVKQFIIASLAPAHDIDIVLNEKAQSAQVTVPEDQLSLAIGRDGGNVRLAAKLTGWKIDIKGKAVVTPSDTSTKEEVVVEKENPNEGEVIKEVPIKDVEPKVVKASKE